MSHVEKLEALLDEMGVWYEREDNDYGIFITIPGKAEGFKNDGFGDAETLIRFDTYGNCVKFEV